MLVLFISYTAQIILKFRGLIFIKEAKKYFSILFQKLTYFNVWLIYKRQNEEYGEYKLSHCLYLNSYQPSDLLANFPTNSILYHSRNRQQANQNNCSQLGPTLKLSTLDCSSTHSNTLQVLQRTAMIIILVGPRTPCSRI